MIEKKDVYITPFQTYRTVHIYLPEDYVQSNESYPVMYMFDGHNLFYDEDATYGKSWGLKEFLDRNEKKFIVVGLECNHEGNKRLEEFSPYTFSTPFFGYVAGKGDILARWMVQELKPWVDAHYRTLPFRECTGIGGSSMGGLMALYMVIRHNEIFSKAACLSTALFGCKENAVADLNECEISPDTRVYLSLGTEEVQHSYINRQREKDNAWIGDALSERGASVWVRIVEGGQHNEASWEKENPDYFDFLWNR